MNAEQEADLLAVPGCDTCAHRRSSVMFASSDLDRAARTMARTMNPRTLERCAATVAAAKANLATALDSMRAHLDADHQDAPDVRPRRTPGAVRPDRRIQADPASQPIPPGKVTCPRCGAAVWTAAKAPGVPRTPPPGSPRLIGGHRIGRGRNAVPCLGSYTPVVAP